MVGMEMIQSAVKLTEFLVWSDISFVAGWAFFSLPMGISDSRQQLGVYALYHGVRDVESTAGRWSSTLADG